MTLAIAFAAVVAAVFSYAAGRYCVIPLLQRYGVLDHPTARSSHGAPVARGGGIAVYAGLVVGSAVALPVLRFAGPDFTSASVLGTALLPMVAGGLFGLVGLVDDLNSLSATSRLVVQLVLASTFATVIGVITGVGALASVAIGLSIILVVNGTNFMDGLNSLVSSWGAVSALWFGALALTVDSRSLALSMIALASALIGFLPLNVSPARSFLGDVGSYAIGGSLGVGAWVLWTDGATVISVSAPFIVPMCDVLFTLGRRIHRGENIFTAHRTHVYQKLQIAGLRHEQVSAVHLVAVILCLAAALPSVMGTGQIALLIAFAVWAPILAMYLALPIVTRRFRAVVAE